MIPDPIAALTSDDLARIDRLLHTFVSEAGARCALLLDRVGRPLASSGSTGEMDETSFASLAAADFDAGDELARLLGEQEFTSLYHQGVNRSMFLCDIGGRAILAAIFDRRTTLGMVRLETREIVPRLVAVLDDLRQPGAEGPRLQSGFTDDAVGEIDRLFAG